MKTVVTLPRGDGIGPEVVESAVRVIEATGSEIEWDVRDAGAGAISRHGAPLPEETLESIRKNRLCLKGPLATPIDLTGDLGGKGTTAAFTDRVVAELAS